MTKAIDIALELQKSKNNIALGDSQKYEDFTTPVRSVYEYSAPWEKSDPTTGPKFFRKSSQTAPVDESIVEVETNHETPVNIPVDITVRPEHFTEDYVKSVTDIIPEIEKSTIVPSFTAYTIDGKDYARATGVIDHRTTSNDFKHVNLREWQEDCLVSGFAKNPQLISDYLTASSKQWAQKEKRAIKKRAKALGGAEDGSNYGSLIHEIMESWAAHPDKLAVFYKTLPGYLFEALMENIDLFTKNDLEIVSSENIVIVSDTPPIAGTFDNIIKDKNGELFIHDYKSTKTSSMPYSYNSYALQMYMYAQAKTMVTKTGEKKPKPEVNQDYGYLTHTPLDGPARMLTIDYSQAKEELSIVLESFAAQYARDQKIQEIQERFKDYKTATVL